MLLCALWLLRELGGNEEMTAAGCTLLEFNGGSAKNQKNEK